MKLEFSCSVREAQKRKVAVTRREGVARRYRGRRQTPEELQTAAFITAGSETSPVLGAMRLCWFQMSSSNTAILRVSGISRSRKFDRIFRNH